MDRFFWICLAGAAGTGARYILSLWAGQRIGDAFPYGTLLVNILGCFLIVGLMHGALMLNWSSTTRAVIAVGFLGGFTTYSAFNYDTMRLLDEGSVGTAATNVVLTLLGGWVAGWLGLVTARALLGR